MKESASRKRWFRWAAVLIAISPAIALLCINAAFLVPKVREKTISIAGRRLGLSGTSDSLRYTPWSGIHLTNFKVGDGSLIRADSISLDLEETKLFSRIVSMNEVSFVGATFTFLYRQPEAPPIVAAAVPETPTISSPQIPQTAPNVAQEKPLPPKTTPSATPKARKRWSTSIGSIQIRDVRFVVRSEADGDDLILAEGFDFILPSDGEGEISLRKLTIIEHEIASDIKGNLAHAEGGAINVSSLTGNVLNAPLTGTLQLAPQSLGMPFAADLAVGDLKHPLVNGSADAALKIQGGALNPLSWRGQVQIQTPEKISLTAFPSTEFSQAQLQAVIQSGTFQIVDARATASSSGALSLRASGRVNLSGNLAINLRPYIFSDVLPATQKLLAPVFGGHTVPFALLPPSPLAYTDFAIRGKANAPQLYFSAEHPPLPLLNFLKDFENPSAEN